MPTTTTNPLATKNPHIENRTTKWNNIIQKKSPSKEDKPKTMSNRHSKTETEIEILLSQSRKATNHPMSKTMVGKCTEETTMKTKLLKKSTVKTEWKSESITHRSLNNAEWDVEDLSILTVLRSMKLTVRKFSRKNARNSTPSNKESLLMNRSN